MQRSGVRSPLGPPDGHYTNTYYYRGGCNVTTKNSGLRFCALTRCFFGSAAAAGHPAIVIMAVINTDDFSSVEQICSGGVEPGDTALRIEKQGGKTNMKTFEYTIIDPVGMHARPAGILVREIRKYVSTVTVIKDGKSVNALKLMALMTMGIKQGSTVKVTVEREDEDTRFRMRKNQEEFRKRRELLNQLKGKENVTKDGQRIRPDRNARRRLPKLNRGGAEIRKGP